MTKMTKTMTDEVKAHAPEAEKHFKEMREKVEKEVEKIKKEHPKEAEEAKKLQKKMEDIYAEVTTNSKKIIDDLEKNTEGNIYFEIVDESLCYFGLILLLASCYSFFLQPFPF